LSSNISHASQFRTRGRSRLDIPIAARSDVSLLL